MLRYRILFSAFGLTPEQKLLEKLPRHSRQKSKHSRHFPCSVQLESWQNLDCERHGGASLHLLLAMSTSAEHRLYWIRFGILMARRSQAEVARAEQANLVERW